MISTTNEYEIPADTNPLGSEIDTIEQKCTVFIRKIVDVADADGVVVTLSGGVDSATAVTLAVNALGSDCVYGLVLPTASTPKIETIAAQNFAFDLGIPFRTIDIQSLINHYIDAMSLSTGKRTKVENGVRSSVGFVELLSTSIDERAGYTKAINTVGRRLRMIAASFEANTTNRIVLGTSNRVEHYLGNVTTDSGVDLLPIGDLYNTEVYQLARYLGVPEYILEKPPTARQWDEHIDRTELGAPYEMIDAILRNVVDEGRSVEETATKLSVDVELVATFAQLYETTGHKCSLAPTPATYSPEDH